MVERYAITDFSSGEASPRIESRVTERRYASSCKTMLNFRGLGQGPAQYCAGTEYVESTKTPGDRVWLMDFRYSPDQSYILEFGDQYVRFWRDHGQLLSGGSPLEVATPYVLADLTSAKGTFALRFFQSGDSLFIVHPSYWPRELQRVTGTSWTLTRFMPDDGPFMDENTTATTVYASASSGSITLTASANIFAATDVDSLFYLEAESITTPPWRAGETGIAASAGRRVDLRVYRESGVGGTAGTATPTHTTGAANDGSLTWTYEHAGAGWVRITGYTSGTQVTATVLQTLPVNVIGAGNTTTLWAYGAWSDTNGYPSQVSIFRERLVFEQDLTFQFSEAGVLRAFGTKTAGEITAANGFTRKLYGDGLGQVQWVHSGANLEIGTAGGELTIQEITTSDPFGPENASVVARTRYRSLNMAALPVNDVTLFIQPSGRKLREWFFDFSRDSFRGPDMTFVSEHITKPGIVQLAYCAEPVSTIYAVRSDGVLLQMTYERENEVVGWSRRQIGGGGFVESIASIPNPDDGTDDLWLIVRRTINGATARYVEWMHQPLEEGDDIADGWYLDSAVRYDGAATTGISGLGHLEGATVRVLADGFTHPELTVASGAITLNFAAAKVLVGFSYPGLIETQRPEADRRMGSSIGAAQRYSHMVVDLQASGAGAGTKVWDRRRYGDHHSAAYR
jgi:hypothetical protein